MRSALLLVFLSATVFAVVAQETPRKRWHFPADDKAIVSQEPARPYTGNGLPEGVVSVLTKYREPGLRVRRPGGSGYWRFENVAKLYYGGRLFAVVGAATCLSSTGQEMGCLNDLVIYYEDGDGKLERPVNIND